MPPRIFAIPQSKIVDFCHIVYGAVATGDCLSKSLRYPLRKGAFGRWSRSPLSIIAHIVQRVEVPCLCHQGFKIPLFGDAAVPEDQNFVVLPQ